MAETLTFTLTQKRSARSDVTYEGVNAINHWTTGYVKRHPLASLTTVGEQLVLGLRIHHSMTRGSTRSQSIDGHLTRSTPTDTELAPLLPTS
jgi:hypothetical protein